jgi:hypothetical protein
VSATGLPSALSSSGEDGVADYKWRVEIWDADRACWVPDGTESYSSGVSTRVDGTAQEAAERLLRNWTEEYSAMTVSGRWRATVWNWKSGQPLGEPAASAETTCPRNTEDELEAGR